MIVTSRKIIIFLAFFAILCSSFRILPVEAEKKNKALKYTEQFKIEYLQDNVKIITDSAGRKLLLVPRGVQTPVKFKKYPVIRTPIHKVLFASVTQVCFLRPISDPAIWRSVIGVTSPKDEWYIPQIKSGLENGSIKYIGDSYKPNFELIQAIQPEIVFVYTGPTGQYSLIKILEELKIPYVVDNDYLEDHPLGRLEWLKFIAAFYNKDREADDYLKQSVQRIEHLQKQLHALKKPKVAWGMIYNGKAFVPGNRSFAAKTIAMAGGEYVFNKINGVSSLEISMEQFYLYARDADILIYAVYPSYAPSLNAIQSELPLLGEFKAVKRQQVWSLQPWYNQLLDKTDEIIFDLSNIFHPNLKPGYPIKHFQKIPR